MEEKNEEKYKSRGMEGTLYEIARKSRKESERGREKKRGEKSKKREVRDEESDREVKEWEGGRRGRDWKQSVQVWGEGGIKKIAWEVYDTM